MATSSVKDRNAGGLIRGALNLSNYHQIMNDLYEEVVGDHWMVHFPYFGSQTDSLIDGQVNLTEACLRYFPPLGGKRLLEVGCGNGVQAMYTLQHRNPAWVTGLDFNPENVTLGRRIAKKKGLTNIDFVHSDAQNMTAISDDSYDCLLNVESAFHYPDKDAFFREINRVLKPGGVAVIADILMKPNKRNVLLRWWERRLSQNYWPIGRYTASLKSAGLKVTAEEDITEPVLKGWGTSKHWFRNESFRGPIRKALIMIFMRLQVMRHVYYLRKVCTYNIFVCHKPEEVPSP